MHTNGAGSIIAHVPAIAFGSEVEPNFDVLQAMPNAYFSKSKEGLYAPLKLTRTHQRWTGIGDLVSMAGSVLNPSAWLIGGKDLPAAAQPSTVWPHVNILTAGGTMGNWDPPYPETTSPFLNDCVCHFAARNLAVTTSFTFFVRMGLEIQCYPSSPYATHLKLSPPEDQVAVSNYFQISRGMKDGYPADYNDLGKIWEVISGIAKQVAPAISMIPGVGGPIGAAIGGVASLGDMIAKRVAAGTASGTKGSKASEADRQLAQQVVAAASSAPRRQIRPKRKRRVMKIVQRASAPAPTQTLRLQIERPKGR
jgi:hypothetical protein